MRINPEDRTIHGLSTFITLVVLNVIYLICCLPVITIGAATVALNEVMIRFSDEEGGRPLRDFFPAFGREFGRATAVFFTFAIPVVLLATGAIFWFNDPSVIGLAAAAVSLLAAAFLFTAMLHSFALVATHRAPYRATVKNALLLTAAEPARSIGILLIPVVLFALAVIMPPFTFVLATIGFSFGAYASAFLFRSAHRRHEAADAEAA